MSKTVKVERRSEILNLRITPSTKAALSQIAVNERRTMSNLANRVLKMFIQEYSQRTGMEVRQDV